jgi:hypothetical protein
MRVAARKASIGRPLVDVVVGEHLEEGVEKVEPELRA